MKGFDLSDLLIIYSFFIVFICVGVVFLLLGLNKWKNYNLSRRVGNSDEWVSTGTPFYTPDVGQVDSLKCIEGDRRLRSMSKTFIKTGIIFLGIGLLGIIFFTITRMI